MKRGNSLSRLKQEKLEKPKAQPKVESKEPSSDDKEETFSE
jgi:hypothetical protein